MTIWAVAFISPLWVGGGHSMLFLGAVAGHDTTWAASCIASEHWGLTACLCHIMVIHDHLSRFLHSFPDFLPSHVVDIVDGDIVVLLLRTTNVT